MAHLPMILIVLSGFGVWRIRRDRAKGVEPRFGGEKQLLAAIQSAGGTMTPVEAALETSLTVDEAQDILTRLADHGPLFVEGRDGVLSYVLPGGRARGRGGA